MINNKIILLIFFTLIFEFEIFSHSIETEITKTETITIKFKYSPQISIKNAKVKIFFPKDYEKPYLILNTNDNGEISFVAKEKGGYIILASDESGHTKRVNINVGEKNNLTNISSLTFIQKILISLIIIWASISTALYFNIKKKKNV